MEDLDGAVEFVLVHNSEVYGDMELPPFGPEVGICGYSLVRNIGFLNIPCGFCRRLNDEGTFFRCYNCGKPSHKTCVTKLQTSIKTNIDFICGNCKPKLLRGNEKKNANKLKMRSEPTRNLQCPKDQTVKLLLELNAGVNVLNHEQETPLLIAIKSNAVESVKMLIKAGAFITACSTRRETTLHVAARHACLEIVELLARNGVSIDSEDCIKQTPMVLAASRGHLPIMKYLHSNGAKLDIKIHDGRTLLHRTTWHGHLEATNWLLKQGLDPNCANREGWTPLHNTAVLGHVHIATLLIDHGAAVNKRTVHEETAFSIAKLFNRTEFMEFLCSKGGYE